MVFGGAVVVLIPDDHNRVVAFFPGWRFMDGVHQRLDRHIAAIHRRWIKPSLRPVIVWVEIAKRASVAAAVLVVALIRRDEGIVGNVPRRQIRE